MTLVPSLGHARRRVPHPGCRGDGSRRGARARLSPAVQPLDLRVIWSASPFAVIRSILGAEVTILDLTPGPEGTHRYVLMQFPWLDERVLVVSRTSLPFNVVPLHGGGSSLFHPATRSNPDLAAWVLQMIVGLGSGARRSFGQRMRGALWPGSDPPRVARQPNVDVFIG